MSGGWKGSDRKQRLPADWPTLRMQVRIRSGGTCEVIRDSTKTRCTNPADDCDHIIPGDDHSLENLRDICRWHHKAKSSAEGNQAQAVIRQKAKRPPERHPGLR